jgi:hypothetical protein
MTRPQGNLQLLRRIYVYAAWVLWGPWVPGHWDYLRVGLPLRCLVESVNPTLPQQPLIET